MNKLFTKIASAALGLTMAIGVGTVIVGSLKETPLVAEAAETYEVTAGNLVGWTSSQAKQNGTSGAFSLNSTGGANNTQIRLYSGNTHTFTCNGGNITKAVFTCTADNDSNYGPGKMKLASGSAGSYSYSGKIGTWTGSSNTFSLSGGQSRVTSIVFTYESTTQKYIVSFDSNGGTEIAEKEVYADGTFEFPNPGSKKGYEFEGWSSDNGVTKYAVGATSPAVIKDITYTAYWKEVATYSVNYVASNNGSGTYIHQEQNEGNYQLLPFEQLEGIVANDGYRFKNYTVGSETKNPGDIITLSSNTEISVNFEVKPQEYTFDFTEIEGFSSWGSSYSLHTVSYSEGTVTFKEASKQTTTITDQPVTKGQPVTFVSSGFEITSVKLECTQWTTKAQTITLHYSTNGGSTYTTTGTTSSDFTLTKDEMPKGTNAIQFTFSNTSNQIGITNLTVGYTIPAVLESVTTEGQKTGFKAGDKFSYGGTLTANYTQGKESATVTPTSYKIGAGGITPTISGAAINSSTILTLNNNGQFIYVLYTEGGITKWVSYQISVEYADVTSLTLSVYTAKIGLNEIFDCNSVTVTIESQYANQGYEWLVVSNTVEDDYLFEDNQLISGSTTGIVVLRCQSTTDNSKYAELTVTVTGQPVAKIFDANGNDLTNQTINEFASGEDILFDIEARGENFGEDITYSWTSNNETSVGIESEGNYAFIAFLSGGTSIVSCTIKDSSGKTAVASFTVVVTDVVVVSLSWEATDIDVWSGDVLTSDIADDWWVCYLLNNGSNDVLTSEDFTLELDGEEIVLPYTWSSDDNGKELCAKYQGFKTETINVYVTQKLQSVIGGSSEEYKYEFTSKLWDALGTKELNGITWTADGVYEGNGYFGFDTDNNKKRGHQFGSGKAWFSELTLSTSDFAGEVTNIVVETSGATDINATLTVSVGGNQIGNSIKLTKENASYEFTCNGESGDVTLSYVNNSEKAIYVKSIAVTTKPGDIANNEQYKAGQRAVVTFAKAFNAAMDTTNNCQTNMENAWDSASQAWDEFLAEINGLSAQEKAYALNLIKNARGQYTEGTDEDYSYALARALKTYDICVTKYSMSGFMGETRTLNAYSYNGLSIINKDNSSALLITILSLCSVAAIGGYFFIKKRKEVK